MENRVRFALPQLFLRLLIWLVTGGILLAFTIHGAVVLWSTGFQYDDYSWIARVHAHNAREMLPYFDPRWGWYYRPIFLCYFALMRECFGTSAPIFHLTSGALHLLNALLLSGLAVRILRQRAAAWCGIVFYIAPTTYRSVVWISCASVLLAACFSFLALHVWLFFLDSQRPLRFAGYGGALAACALALGSKEEALALPMALFLLCLQRSISFPRALKMCMPFGFLLLLSVVLSSIAGKHQHIFFTQAVFDPVAVFVFYYWVWGDFFGTDVLALQIFSVLAFIFVLWRLRDPFVWGVFAVSFVIAIPAPLLTGPHSLFGWFYYLPLAGVMFLAATLLARHGRRWYRSACNFIHDATVSVQTHGDSLSTQLSCLLIAATGAALVRAIVFLGQLPYNLIMASGTTASAVGMALTLLATVILWRAGFLKEFTAVFIVGLAGMTSLIAGLWYRDLFVHTILFYALFFVPLCGSLVSLTALKYAREPKENWWMGGAIVWLLWGRSGLVLPLALLILLMLRRGTLSRLLTSRKLAGG